MTFLGEYEETISQSWHSLTNLRAFFTKATCPQPILTCYNMFKSLVPSDIHSPLDVQDTAIDLTFDNNDSDENSHLCPNRKYETLSDSLQMALIKALGSDITIPSRALFSNQVMINNQSFTLLRCHRGNSTIFHVNSNVPFCIDTIVEFEDSVNRNLQGRWLVGRSLKPIDVQDDPYSKFPHLRAKLWGTEFESQVEVCRLDDVKTHVAQHWLSWEGKDATVVISLSRVSVLFF